MPVLSQVQTIRPSPNAWSPELVRQRLVEAFTIDRRMPGERRYGTMASAWPASPIHEFVDVVHWSEGEQRERVWESWERSAGVSPQEITRWEEAFNWLRWAPLTERRCLEAWAFAAATNRSVSAILKHRRWKRTSFYRQRDHAAQRIADRLNRQGVQVR